MTIIRKTGQVIAFTFFYIKELLFANFRVLHDILTPRHRMSPGFVMLPLDARTDLEIFILANLISMTPGTISVDISQDKKFIFLHVMYLENIEAFRQMIKQKFEARVLEVLR